MIRATAPSSRGTSPDATASTTSATPTTSTADDRPALRHGALAVAAVVLQVLPGLLPGRPVARTVLPLVSHVLVAVWLVANVAGARARILRGGLAVAATGWLLNMAVMLPNGGMPVSYGALSRLGAAGTRVADGHLYKHVALAPGTVLGFLGDVHPLAAAHLVYSVGDVLLFGGLIVAVGAVIAGNLRRTPTRGT